MPRLALFDLDETLIGPPDGPFRAAMAEFAAERGLGDDELAWLTGPAVQYWSDPETSYFDAVAARYRITDSPAALYEMYRARYMAAIEPEPGVLDGLADLRTQGWRIAIVTNGPTGPQRAKIEHLRLPEMVDAVCISEAENCRKPDREIFERAAELAGGSLDRGWMIGDSLDADIAGGVALGLTTAWVSQGRPAPVTGAVPTHVLDAVADVFPLILADI